MKARRGFDLVAAGIFLSGLLVFLWGCLYGRAAETFAYACLFLATVSLVYGVRHLRQAWRPQRTTLVAPALGFVLLIVVPSSLVSVDPLRSLVLAACGVIALVAFLAFREAFTAAPAGLLSARGFATLATVGCLGIVGTRLAGQLAGLTGAGLPWYSLALEEGQHSQAFNHQFDFMLVVAFPIVMAMAGVAQRKAARLAWWTCTLIIGLGILVSFCRAAWLALAVELLIFAWRGRPWRRAVLAGAVIAVLVMFAVPGMRGRFTSIATGSETGSQRLEQWAAAMVLIGRSPLLGHGLGSFGELYRQFQGAYTDRMMPCPHNLYLHVAVECGLPALCVLMVWAVRILGDLVRRLRTEIVDPVAHAFVLAGLAAATGVLCFGLFDL